MVFNGVYVSEAENSFASIKQNAPELIDNIAICVSDENAKLFAEKHGLRSFDLSKITETGSYLSKPMNIMGRRKIECILHLLEQGEDVFYFDTDIVFMHNPIGEFNRNFDINLQIDECSRPYKNKRLCTGFMLIRSTEKSKKLLHDIIDRVVVKDYQINDQNALDQLVRERSTMSWHNLFGPSISVLDPCKFPNGCRYFGRTDKYCSREQALIIHNNHIIGIENKYARFLKHGLIFANNETRD